MNPSSVDDDHMEDSDAEKDSDGKPATVKASSSMSGLDEYEFKDEEEEEDLSKALNDRHILRRELRQREKEEKDKNHVAGKQGSKGDSSRSKKQKTSRVLPCSSDSSSDEMESLPEKRSSPTCTQSSEGLKSETRTKKENAEQKDKGKVKRKSKSQNKNKENQEDGKENSKALVFSVATVSESTDKSRDEDSFKMSFSPKDDSSVHLFHLSSVKSPKLNYSLTDKLATPLKQENTKTCVSISDSSCPVDGVKYNHYTEADYCTEGASTKGCKHKEKSKHHQKDSNVDGEDGGSSPYKEGSIGNSVDSSEGAIRKTDVDGKVVKKHKLKHKEKDKHRREYEAERSRHKQKEARKDGHRNLEFDREFWKENFFKSDENDEPLPVKKEGEDGSSPQKTLDSPPVKEERGTKEKHSCNGSNKEKKQREEREKDKAVKKERKESICKEERGKDAKLSERDERVDCHGSGRIPEELLQNTSMKEEAEDRPISGITADQDQLESSEKGMHEKTDKRLPGKEREAEKMEKRYPDKEKKVKVEHSDKAETQNSMDRWKEKERMAANSSHSPGDKNHRESEKLRSLSTTKKHEDSRKNKDRLDKRSDRERPEREYSGGEHREKDRTSSDKRGKPLEKTTDHSRSDRSKEKDCDRKKKDKVKDGALSSSSNLKLLLEEKKGYVSESGKSVSTKSKEEALKTPEKDRDRRDRDRDSDRHRDRDKDKERHKDRSQQGKVSKTKPNESEADGAKLKASPAPRDTRPKEKRLVNDDLMQTSFERMLSLKDQEIEQWHRKHLEKIKQKERERLKQRPSADSAKSKSKDKVKTEPCLSKELLRSKSSETSDAHSREKLLKDGTSFRTMSLDGKSLSSISSKVMTGMENNLSRSPRPECERSGLMSRSVSMISVASSEDSCQATTLTPRPIEYDSDINLEASDSQPPFLQSSLVSQSTRSPSVHDKDCSSLPDAMQSNRTPLSSRHESPCLRAILDEDANSSSAEGKSTENLPKASVTEEPRAAEVSTDTDESLNSHNLVHLQNTRSDIDSSSEREGNTPGSLTPQTSNRDTPNKDPVLPQPSLSQASGSQPIAEQMAPSNSDPLLVREVQCLPVESSNAEAECRSKALPSDPPLVSTAVLSAEPSAFTNAKTSMQTCSQQREPLPSASMETPQQAESVSALVPDHKENPVESAVSSAESGHESMESVSEGSRTERMDSPLPSTSTHIPSSSPEESMPGLSKVPAELKYSQEDMDVNNQDCKKSRPFNDVGGPCDDPQMDKNDDVLPTSSSVSHCVSPEHKAEDMTDISQCMDKNTSAESSTATESSSQEGSFATECPSEMRAEPSAEPMEVVPAEERPESSSAVGEQSQSGVQPTAPIDQSCNSSGGSSPQSGDRDSDSSGAKAKIRSLDEELDIHLPHPRKRKMPKMSLSQPCCTSQQGKETGQQSLAAIVDSVKLEEIQPYQTERANPYYEFLHIRRKIEEKRKVLCSVIPQPPQYYDEYVTFNGSYLLDGNPLSKLCIPTVSFS